jgi:hypothetical protein
MEQSPPDAAEAGRLRAAFRAIGGRIERLGVDRFVALVVFGATLIGTWQGARFFARIDGPLHFDDAYVAPAAARLIQGRFLPYVDAVGQRGPLFYWLAAWAQAWGGWSEWVGIRRLGAAGFVLTVAALVGAGFAARRPLAGAFGGLLYVGAAFAWLEPQALFGMVGEPFANLFALAATALTALALTGERSPGARTALLALAGAVAACAALAKQTYLLVFAPCFLWALAFHVSRAPGGFEEVAAMLGGWVLPFLAVLIAYARAGELSTFFYWCFTYNRDVYMGPYKGLSLVTAVRDWAKGNAALASWLSAALVASFGRALFGLRGPWRELPRAYARAGFAATIALQLAISLFAAAAPMRFWSQYYLSPAPWLALCAGLLIADALELGLARPFPRGGRRAGFFGGLAVAVALFGLSLTATHAKLRGLRRERKAGAWANARPERACQTVDEFVQPDESIFVWGFDGDLYLTCRRRPASRYVYTTLVAGAVPPFWKDLRPERTARDAVASVLEELRSERPPLVFDTPDRMRGISLSRVLPLSNYVSANYCKKPAITANDGRHITVWVRNDRCKGAAPPKG